jgi:hypothetical protein
MEGRVLEERLGKLGKIGFEWKGSRMVWNVREEMEIRVEWDGDILT